MTVTVNGRPQEAVPGETVESLLDRLGLAAQYALVERNGEPVERALLMQVPQATPATGSPSGAW